MEILNQDDIAPDGVRMIVDWDRMRVSDSVFVPCVNVKVALKQLRPIFDRRSWKLRVHVSVENHIMGVRIWRIT